MEELRATRRHQGRPCTGWLRVVAPCCREVTLRDGADVDVARPLGRLRTRSGGGEEAVSAAAAVASGAMLHYRDVRWQPPPRGEELAPLGRRRRSHFSACCGGAKEGAVTLPRLCRGMR